MVTELIINKVENNENFILEGGAGSGKTYTLIEVIDELIERKKKVAVITYTNVAKEEIIERLLKKDKEVDFCGTIHEFIWKQINKFHTELNKIVKTKFSDEVVETGVYKIIYDFGYHNVNNEDFIIKISHDEVIEIFMNIMDKYSDLYSIIANIYDCILVDEYQDTKQEVIDVLLNDKLSICCGFFGDSVQGIYAEEGLNMNNTEIIPKEDNWRSSQKLINFFNDVRNNINNNDIVQKSENINVRDYDSKLLYYEVEEFTNELKEKIEGENKIKIDKLLFLTHNLGLSNQVEINRSYNSEFGNNQRKYSNNKDEIYTHLNFLFDLYEMKKNNIFETKFVDKYFNIKMNNKKIVEEWRNKIQTIKNCNMVSDLKNLSCYELLNQKLKEEIEVINDGMDIDYFNKMYEYSLESSEDRTMFSMKGLEADNILVYLNNGRWTQYNFSNLNERTKKILYVAITRAKKNLIIVANTDIDDGLKKIILKFFEKKVID